MQPKWTPEDAKIQLGLSDTSCVHFLSCLNLIHSLYKVVVIWESRRMRWAGLVVRMGERSGVYRVLVGKPEGKRPLGRLRLRWEDNIEMDL
jgi:hypothetical protein